MTKLEICGDKFMINGALTYSEYANCPESYKGLLMNARFIQGIYDDKGSYVKYQRYGRSFEPEKNTKDLIKALPQWYQKGLRAFTVGFQGGGSCFTIANSEVSNAAYSEDGKSIDVDYLRRMKELVEAADQLHMVVIVSLFYGAQTRFLKDDLAVMSAVKTASNWLRDQKFKNVIIELANEHNERNYMIHPILYQDQGVMELIEIARRESGGIPVGCSDLSTKFSLDVAKVSDVIFIHGNKQSRQQFYQTIRQAKGIRPRRPIVCNEDSQTLSQMQVALDEGISWGYYNNATKQEVPCDWGITKGEDEFFATRLALSLGIEDKLLGVQERFYLQGLEEASIFDQKAWIRLASLYPEQVHKVVFYRNEEKYETVYNPPFSINYINNWNQGPVTNLKCGEVWKAVITLTDGSIVTKQTIL